MATQRSVAARPSRWARQRWWWRQSSGAVGVVDGDEVVSANVHFVAKGGHSRHFCNRRAGGEDEVALLNRCCAGGHAKEGPSSVTDEQGRVGGCTRTAGGPRHHDRNITAQSSIAEVRRAGMGGEHAGVDVVLLDGRTCEDPQVTSDDFEAVDLVVGQPVGARPRGLPEVEGGVEARDAGVFRTEQDLRPICTMEVTWSEWRTLAEDQTEDVLVAVS